MCSKMRWFVLLTWNHPIREQVFPALIVLLIQSELIFDVLSHSGTISHSKFHFGCGRGLSCAFLISISSTSTTTILQKLYFSFRNAPMSNQPSSSAVRDRPLSCFNAPAEAALPPSIYNWRRSTSALPIPHPTQALINGVY